MRKILSILLISVLILTGLYNFKGWNKLKEHKVNVKAEESTEEKKDINLNIMTTDKFLYYMVKDIVKDRHYVDFMFNDRSDELNFEFSEDSSENISRKDLFIYLGGGFEPWINDFINKLDKSKVGVINVCRGAKLLSFNKDKKCGDKVYKYNPYYWMNVNNYKIALLNVKNAIQDKDPKNRDFYEKNFSDSIRKVDEYNKKLKDTLKQFKNITFISNEESLEYFLRFNNLKTIKLEDYEKGNRTKGDNKNLVFLYNEKEQLEINKELIRKYNIKCVNIKIYDNLKYICILDNNIKNLQEIIEIAKV